MKNLHICVVFPISCFQVASDDGFFFVFLIKIVQRRFQRSQFYLTVENSTVVNSSDSFRDAMKAILKKSGLVSLFQLNGSSISKKCRCQILTFYFGMFNDRCMTILANFLSKEIQSNCCSLFSGCENLIQHIKWNIDSTFY